MPDVEKIIVYYADGTYKEMPVIKEPTKKKLKELADFQERQLLLEIDPHEGTLLL
jgi:hypothetical protein